MKQTAIVAGITGQDGAYLSRLLLEKGYEVIGLVRSYNSNTRYGLAYLGILERLILIECDLLDVSQIISILKKYKASEFYNLSAQSSVSISFQQPIGTFQYNTLSVMNILEAIRLTNKNIRFYQASSSEMFGKVNELPITENSVMHPLSPYAVSKAAAHWLCVNYRESYGLFITCGILFNHESYLRSNNFFIKKVIRDSLRIRNSELSQLRIGNIEIKRDFGYAPKYVEAMYLMMQGDSPQDYLVCSGQSVSLRECIEYIFGKLDISKEKIVVDPDLYRPTDIENIYGSNEKAKRDLGWEYNMSFFEVLDILVEEELANSRA